MVYVKCPCCNAIFDSELEECDDDEIVGCISEEDGDFPCIDCAYSPPEGEDCREFHEKYPWKYIRVSELGD